MAGAKEIRTFKNIQDAIIDRASLEDTENQRNSLKEKINTTYLKICYDEPYRWTGATSPYYFPKKYSTGTISVTNGSDEITGSGTAWDDHLGWKMKIGSDNVPRKVIRVGSSTTITLDSRYFGTTQSGLSYILYQDEFGMFPDMIDIRWLEIFGYRTSKQPLPTSPEKIRRMQNLSPYRTGVPEWYTMYDNNYYHQKTWATFNISEDFWEDSSELVAPRNENLIIYPGVRNDDLVGKIRYTEEVYPMINDSDEPKIPYINRSILVWGTLVDHFLSKRNIDLKREWEAMYLRDKRDMESDIENIDDEFKLIRDNTNIDRISTFGNYNEETESGS